MSERAVDPSGLIAGFADAAGGFLPLAATLNCTLAVDRVAGWLGLDREAVAERTDGDRRSPTSTASARPTCPAPPARSPACATTPSRGQILLAAYEGAVASLVEALELLAPVGLRARPGRAGRADRRRRARARLAADGGAPVGPRACVVPEAEELVALGAAAQAAAVLTGEPPAEVARRWDTRGGATVEPPAEPRHRDAGAHPRRRARPRSACSDPG